MLRLLSLVALLCLVAYTSGQLEADLRREAEAIASESEDVPPPPPSQESAAVNVTAAGQSGFAVAAASSSSRGSCPARPRLYWCRRRYRIASYRPVSRHWCCCRCSRTPGCFYWTHIPFLRLCILWRRCPVRTFNLWGAYGARRWYRRCY